MADSLSDIGPTAILSGNRKRCNGGQAGVMYLAPPGTAPVRATVERTPSNEGTFVRSPGTRSHGAPGPHRHRTRPLCLHYRKTYPGPNTSRSRRNSYRRTLTPIALTGYTCLEITLWFLYPHYGYTIAMPQCRDIIRTVPFISPGDVTLHADFSGQPSRCRHFGAEPPPGRSDRFRGIRAATVP